MAAPDSPTATSAAHAFARAINRQDVEGMAALMTEDHVFIDSLGTRVEGRERMKAGWAAYFQMIPDYTITIEETFPEGPTVLMFGSAQGTYAVEGALLPENRWRTPAAWRAVTRGNSIAEWRVYADNDPLRRIMREPRLPERG